MLGVPAAQGRWYASAFVQLLVSDPRVVVNARGEALRRLEERPAGSGAGVQCSEYGDLIGALHRPQPMRNDQNRSARH